jgi:hypothetical protein
VEALEKGPSATPSCSPAVLVISLVGHGKQIVVQKVEHCKLLPHVSMGPFAFLRGRISSGKFEFFQNQVVELLVGADGMSFVLSMTFFTNPTFFSLVNHFFLLLRMESRDA